tara:strand:+ start:1323 stop:1736 length:414 start_codon:yes stop_codon:yes gene_type:complete
MTKSVVTVEMDDSLAVVKNIFDNTSFHHLLVIEHFAVVGIISDRDLLKALSPNIGTAAESVRDAATLNKKVHQIMSRNVISLLPSTPIYQVISTFIQHNISCIPIIDIDGKLVGILTWRDIFRVLEAHHREKQDTKN